MKKVYFITIISLLLVFSNYNASATHVMGGNIDYKYIGGDTFKITLKLYRDCSGILLPTSITIAINSTCYNKSISLPRISSSDVTPICNANTATPCTPISGQPILIPIGVEEHIYEAIIVIPGTLSCDIFTFSYSECCRNNAITNISSPGSSLIYIESELNRTLFPGNSSPVFFKTSQFFGITNQVNHFDFSAIDIDGDSLSYELYTPQQSNNSTVSYNTGFSASNPINSLVPIQFNNVTGILTVVPSGQQLAVLGVKVNKYRNGNLIGFVKKDIQVIIFNQTNQNPIITGIDSTSTNFLVGYVGDTIDFNIYGIELDTGQAITMTPTQSIPGASFNVTGTPNLLTGNFKWILDSSHVQFRPYLFGVTVRDDNCPLVAEAVQIIRINVLNSSTMNLWPGDADNNNIADIYDLLPIGIAYGTSGPARANASTNWTAQPAVNWPQMFVNTLNYKFADANGDGVVDSLDVDVVNLNYGMTHQKTTLPSGKASGDLYIEIPEDTLIVGQTVIADVFLGSATDTINDLYGLAFKINYDENIVEQGTAQFVTDSWLGNQSLIHLQKESSGGIEVAMSRTDKVNKSGYGKIGTLTFKVREDVDLSAIQDLTIGFSGLKAISNTESELLLTSGSDDAVVVQDPVNIPQFLSAGMSYVSLGNNQYLVKLEAYRDCSGAIFNDTMEVILKNNCNIETAVNLILEPGSVMDVTPTCPQYNSPCDPAPGPLMTTIGIEKSVYSAVITLSSAACDNKVNISFSTCCRSNKITNVNNPLSDNIFIDIELSNGLVPANNSPTYYNNSFYGNVGSLINPNLNVFDPDGDSLVYEMYVPAMNNNSQIDYIQGISIQKPLFTQSHIDTTNPFAGLRVIPDRVQSNIIGLKVYEYRNNTLIGFVKKELLLVIDSASTNNEPEISGIDNTNLSEIAANPGDTISFSIYANDLDASQQLQMNWNSGIANATFTVSGSATDPVGHFYWITDQSQLLNSPFEFEVMVKDDNCPVFSTSTRKFSINIFPTGIPDPKNVYLNIYPNPAKNILTIDTEAGNFNHLTFFDIQGKLIYENHIEKGKAEINVKDLPVGVYIIKLKGEAGSISKKVIVE